MGPAGQLLHLSLHLDAGIPLSEMASGVAMGLVSRGHGNGMKQGQDGEYRQDFLRHRTQHFTHALLMRCHNDEQIQIPRIRVSLRS